MFTIQEQTQNQLLQYGSEEAFDPEVHLNYKPPTSLLTMKDLGLKCSAPCTPIAGSVPFPFLSEAGVRAYRRAIMRPQTLKSCTKPWGTGTFILRNLAQHSKFVHDLWTHPETMKIVSEVAGVPLTIIMPTEIGHTNIQSPGCTVDELIKELEVEPRAKCSFMDEDMAHAQLGASAVIPWHYDSYPYVAVLMLSDTTHMAGGETYIRKGDGSAAKIEGPSQGHCVILQGGQVEHLAARAFGTTERITTITSYRAAVAGINDNSYISNVRPYSDLPELYGQWTSYRLEKMKQEIEHMQSNIIKYVDKYSDSFPLDEISRFADQQISYLKRTVRQMVDQALCAEVRRHFEARKIDAAGDIWARVRAHERLQDLLPIAMAQTMMWKSVSPYVSDWKETKYLIKTGRASSILSQKGNFLWCQNKSEEYLFGDELVRQGLREVLLAWLHRSGLISLEQSRC